jgi:hypothetical protein
VEVKRPSKGCRASEGTKAIPEPQQRLLQKQEAKMGKDTSKVKRQRGRRHGQLLETA